VRDGPPDWRLVRFLDAVEAWIERESPDDDMRLLVMNWIMNRHDDPYRGMRRVDGHPNLWFGPIRETQSQGTVVTSSYWIYELTRTVRCNDICTLSRSSRDIPGLCRPSHPLWRGSIPAGVLAPIFQDLGYQLGMGPTRRRSTARNCRSA
jgi:hypothetical protein